MILIMMMLVLGDVLVIVLMEYCKFMFEYFCIFYFGGKLGVKLLWVEDLMYCDILLVVEDVLMLDVLLVIS